MKTLILPADTPQTLSTALQSLQNGEPVAFPTDTVYGLGALAYNASAINRIYIAKKRPVEKAIPVLLGNPDDIYKVSIDVPEMALKLAARFWPGPLTLVIPKHPDLPEIISSTDGVGVRVPDHPIARALINAAGPLAVTSANLSAQPSTSTSGQVMEQLNGRIAIILDGGKTPGGVPSTVVNCLGIEPVVLREGPISVKEILAEFSPNSN